MQKIGAGIEALARAANRVLYAFFNTAWALVYYVVYWRGPAFFALIVLAFGVDLLRFDRRRCEQVASLVSSRRSQVIWSLALIALLAAIGALVVAFDLRSIASGAAYLHYEQAKLYASFARARLVYVVEATGVSFAFLLQVFFSVQQSAGAAAIRRIPVKQQVFRELWVFLFFLFIVLGVCLFRTWDIAESAATINKSYRPGTDAVPLLLYAASPIFFAIAMKFWLAATYVMRSENVNTSKH